MKFPRRRFLHLAAGAAALPAVSGMARAQIYPNRPVHLILGFPAGGSPDIVARLIGLWLSQRFGQQFIVENRTGATGNIGTEAAVRAVPDGYTLLLAGTPNAINATLYDRLKFNFINDIAPIAGIMSVPNVMEVIPSLPVKTVPEFIAYAKANPGKINFASSGNGSTPHLSGELFKAMTGVNALGPRVRLRNVSPLVRCVACSWVHCAATEADEAFEVFDRCYKCKGLAFELVQPDAVAATVARRCHCRRCRAHPV